MHHYGRQSHQHPHAESKVASRKFSSISKNMQLISPPMQAEWMCNPHFTDVNVCISTISIRYSSVLDTGKCPHPKLVFCACKRWNYLSLFFNLTGSPCVGSDGFDGIEVACPVYSSNLRQRENRRDSDQ